MSIRRGFLALACAFSVRSLVKPDLISFLASTIWVASFFIDRHFNAGSIEKQLIKRLDLLEQSQTARIEGLDTEVKELKKLQSQMNLANGIRGAR